MPDQYAESRIIASFSSSNTYPVNHNPGPRIFYAILLKTNHNDLLNYHMQ